ncbi:MAG: hypothetical protein DMF20_06330 [Verrucomicrobia bacterium]|nr:MAG: hypothetical protein DMF20_06330 [Verrucomicrobiota bacterium]
MTQERGTRTMMLREFIPSPQLRVAINLFPDHGVGLGFARRGDWVGEAPHTYFYAKWKTKVSKMLQNDRIYRHFTV